MPSSCTNQRHAYPWNELDYTFQPKDATNCLHILHLATQKFAHQQDQANVVAQGIVKDSFERSMSTSRRVLEVWRMGMVKYGEALDLQNKLIEQRRLGSIPDTLISLQHPPTFTVGKRHTIHNIISPHEVIQSIGAEVHFSERGGDVTFHGPHQAVLYPIVALRESKLGARRYVEGLEDTMIKLAALYKVEAKGRLVKETGVWVENRKIGAIGVRISGGGIASHGLAFNINPDLSFYSHIIPCGISDKEVSSLFKESPLELPDEDTITQQLINSFVEVFSYDEVIWKEK